MLFRRLATTTWFLPLEPISRVRSGSSRRFLGESQILGYRQLSVGRQKDPDPVDEFNEELEQVFGQRPASALFEGSNTGELHSLQTRHASSDPGDSVPKAMKLSSKTETQSPTQREYIAFSSVMLRLDKLEESGRLSEWEGGRLRALCRKMSGEVMVLHHAYPADTQDGLFVVRCRELLEDLSRS